VTAVENLSLDVRAGEFLVLVGPSGCGKTTVLNLVAGLTLPESGDVLVGGKPVTEPGPDRAVVFQDGALFPWLNVRQNVEFGLRQAGLGREARREKAIQGLRVVGLAGLDDRALHTLSGGMRQRVAIARALVLEPQVILMDEPFSALDAITREEMYVQVQEVRNVTNSTVLFITHNVREAAVLADRIVLMSARPGRIVKTYDDVLPSPRRIEDAEVAELARAIALDMRAAGQEIA
jgi:NitT/TauT family transport system ATP-binding protein